MTTSLVKNYEVIKGVDILFASTKEGIGKDTGCGDHVTENMKGFCCENRDCHFALWKENKFFTIKKKKLNF